VAASLLFARDVHAAHATLLSTEPAAGSVLTTAPHQIRLLFNEQIEPGLSRITLVAPDSHSLALRVQGDPHDVHALVGSVDSLANGAYRVEWRVVSADGHPVGGNFSFSVGAAAEPPPPPLVTTTPTSEESGVGPMLARAPVIAAALRGLGVGCLMALTGLLFFWTRDEGPSGQHSRTLLLVLAIATPLFLAAHAFVWLLDAAPDHQIDAGSFQAALATLAGGAEAVRVGLAILALWAIVLARRIGIALVCAAGALVASSAIGHPAAMHAVWAIPLKALHLFAVAAWLGGLLWLIGADRDMEEHAFVEGAARVSSFALAAVVVVLITGVAESLLFVPSIPALLASAYGLIAVAKLAGLGVLVLFGAYHRYRLLPSLATVGVGGLQRSVRREVVVMTVVVLLGGWLAYVPPPSLLQ
jgi:copper transport protein